MKNKCLHCSGKGYIGDKETNSECETCKGKGFANKHIHKACRSRYNYPVCDFGNNNSNAMVTRNWKIVTCPSCLRLRRL